MRIEVTQGSPSDAELAALVVALTPVADREEAQDAGPAPWQRAAILEGLGGRAAHGAADLAGRHGWNA